MTYDYGFSSDNTVIYERSSNKKDWSHLGETISSPNIGGNQYDVLRFIIENYNNFIIESTCTEIYNSDLNNDFDN